MEPLTEFAFKQLKEATSDFNRPIVFRGKVYKAQLEGKKIVVKLIKERKHALEEIHVMQSVRMHPGVVPLVGYSTVPKEALEDLGDHQMLLVYEFMCGGDLERRLHQRRPDADPLDLQGRIRIALDIARGLKFFHECKPCVVHRDVKPSNVLLDDQGRARMCDFGISREVFSGSTSTVAAGTWPYMDQTMLETGSLKKHPGVDVFSFGVLLLELLSNRQVYPPTRDGGSLEHIRGWAAEKLKDRSKASQFVELWTTSLSDPELEVVWHLGRLALEVTSQPCEERKPMSEVCESLERIAAPVVSSMDTVRQSAGAASGLTDDVASVANGDGSLPQGGRGSGPVPIAVEREASNARDANSQGYALFLQGKFSEAEQYYRRAVELAPGIAAHSRNLGDALFRQRKYSEAEESYRKAVELEPEDAGYANDLGDALFKQRKFRKAEEYFRKAVELEPECALFANKLGHALFKQKNFSGAEQYYQKAVDLDPEHALYANELGHTLCTQGKYSEAEQYLGKAVNLEPGIAGYANDLGAALLRQEKYSEAEHYYRKAVKLEPGNAEYANSLGDALIRQEKYSEAEQFCRTAVQLDPGRAGYANRLGDSLFHQDKFSEAEDNYCNAFKLEPGNAEYASHLAAALLKQEKFSEAEQYHRKAVELDPGNAGYATNLAGALYRQGKYNEAEQVYRRAVQLESGNGEYADDAASALAKTAGSNSLSRRLRDWIGRIWCANAT